MKQICIYFILLFLVLGADIKVVASTTNLGSIAKAIGKDNVDIDVIVKPNQNPHSIQILPSYMFKISRADIYLQVGLKLDYWSQQLIDGSRNSSIVIINCSEKINPIDIPVGTIDPSKGHQHPDGNPHYTLDPNNAKLIAKTILNSFIEKDSENELFYKKNCAEFIDALDKKVIAYKPAFSSYDVISYHTTFNYLNAFLKLKTLDTIEPLPGVSPTPSHLNTLIHTINEHKVKLVLQENYYSEKASNFLVENTGIKSISISPFAEDVTEDSYINHMINLIKQIDEVL